MHRDSDDRPDLRVSDFAGLTRTRFIQQSVDPAGAEAFPPFAHAVNMNPEVFGYGGAAVAIGQAQHHARAQERLSGGGPTRPLLQYFPLSGGNYRNRKSGSSLHGGAPAVLDGNSPKNVCD